MKAGLGEGDNFLSYKLLYFLYYYEDNPKHDPYIY
jgi:hypothetical protein